MLDVTIFNTGCKGIDYRIESEYSYSYSLLIHSEMKGWIHFIIKHLPLYVVFDEPTKMFAKWNPFHTVHNGLIVSKKNVYDYTIKKLVAMVEKYIKIALILSHFSIWNFEIFNNDKMKLFICEMKQPK